MFAPPVVRQGVVPRPHLVARLLDHMDARVVSVVAPAGYGKSTLLAQLSEHEPRVSVWISLERQHNDPTVLFTSVARGLAGAGPVDEQLLGKLSSPVSESVLLGSIVPRLVAVMRRAEPFVLVLDDMQTLEDQLCLDALASVLDHVPPGSRVVLAGRSVPVPLARLRAGGLLAELDQQDLALTEDEAAALLKAAGVDLPAGEVAELERRTEGWAAGLYLAAISIRSGRGGSTTVTLRGDDRYIADYLRQEFLATLSEDELRFMTRASVLDRMSGPLCDAVLGAEGSAAVLEELESANRLLVPLDRTRTWYRYHHLLRDLLRVELDRREPGAAESLAERAADWCQAQGDLESAVEYLRAAGAAERLAEMLTPLAVPMYTSGRWRTLEGWFGWIDDRGVPDRFPLLAVAGAWVFLLAGDQARALRWADAAEAGSAATGLPDGAGEIGPHVALLRAVMCRHGVDAMFADAQAAAAAIPADDPWGPTSRNILAMAHVLRDEVEEADALLAEAVRLATASRNGITAVFSLGIQAALAIAGGDWTQGELLTVRARSLVSEFHLEDHVLSLPCYSVSARLAVHEGDVARARADQTDAQRLRPQVSSLPPWLAVMVLTELARSHLALGDGQGVRTLLREIAVIRRSRPDLGALDAREEEVRAKVDALPSGQVGASSLTAAELRLLPYLSTHLTFREIGSRLFITQNTVKTEAISIYRKLVVSSRSEAVARAREVGLIED